MGFTITGSFIDGQGRPTTKEWNLVNSVTTIAAAQTAWSALLTDFLLATGLGFVKATMQVPLTGATTSAQSPLTNFDEGASMTLLMEDGGEFNERIPAPIFNATLDDYEYIADEKVDVANAAITGYYANFLSAGAFRFTKYGQRILATGGILRGVLERA
jgi:hypothetical protein